MKCTIPEISWHNRDPILSIDIQPSMKNGIYYRLATGGTDSHVVIWQLTILDNGGVAVEILSDLTRHNKAVNAVRFSPDSQTLASSDDDGAIILWKSNDSDHDIFMEETERDNKEHWNVLKILRSHIEDIYDLCWSSCSQYLVSGSVDNSAIIWDLKKGKNKTILKDHKGFVQGVAYDPKGKFVATLSSDRFLRIYNVSSNKVKLMHRVHKAPLPQNSKSKEIKPKMTRLFYDDTLKSFCRRLTFSPDGKLLVAPSGILEGVENKFTNVTHVFSRSLLSRPVMCLPTHDKYAVAVKFCPQLFELRKFGEDNCENAPYTELFKLPYRMIFAVATQNAILIYDTQQPIPFAKVSNIHYTRLSDISWSKDGNILVVSSTDGYCSLVSFTEGELGEPYKHPEKITPMEVDSEIPDSKNEIKKSNPVNSQSKSVNVSSTQKKPLEKINPSNERKAMPIAVKRKSGKRVELVTLEPKANQQESLASNSKKSSEVSTSHQQSPASSSQKQSTSSDSGQGSAVSASLEKERKTSTSQEEEIKVLTSQHESTTSSPREKSTASASKQESTGSASEQESTGSTSKQESSASASKQESTGSTSKQESSASASEQESTGSTSKQESSASAPEQESTGSTSPQENTASSSKQERTASTSVQESTTSTSPQKTTSSSQHGSTTPTTSQQESTAMTSQQESPASSSSSSQQGLKENSSEVKESEGENQSCNKDRTSVEAGSKSTSEGDPSIAAEDKTTKVSSIESESCAPSTKTPAPKAPRRVPLITLSSPKSKKFSKT